jgi:hypothetical protein
MEKSVYRVAFLNNGKCYEIFASQIEQAELFGFIELKELLFNSRSGIVVDPGEEKLKSEFEGVQSSFIPVHSIVRIDKVEKLGVASIGDANSNVITPFPVSPSPNK